jgi:hypothetical protein
VKFKDGKIEKIDAFLIENISLTEMERTSTADKPKELIS